MLFLFDIDGTLLRGMPPAHRQALCDAASEIFGVALAPADLGQTAGMTDGAIARRALLSAGLDASAIAHASTTFFAAAATAYVRHAPSDLRPYHTPFAAEVLHEFRKRELAMGLLTGNIQRIAWHKMALAGFHGMFTGGAFGDEDEDRNALPPFAVRRLTAAHRQAFEPDEIYVVGDTPADIECGQAHGLRTVGVATGNAHTRADLARCEPTHLFDDLRGLLDLA